MADPWNDPVGFEVERPVPRPLSDAQIAARATLYGKIKADRAWLKDHAGNDWFWWNEPEYGHLAYHGRILRIVRYEDRQCRIEWATKNGSTVWFGYARVRKAFSMVKPEGASND